MSRPPSNSVTFLQDRAFWLSHLVLPAAVITLLFAMMEVFRLDRPIAHALYYDAAPQGWMGTGAGDWWANQVIHEGGRWLARLLGVAALFAWLGSFFVAGLKKWRR